MEYYTALFYKKEDKGIDGNLIFVEKNELLNSIDEYSKASKNFKNLDLDNGTVEFTYGKFDILVYVIKVKDEDYKNYMIDFMVIDPEKDTGPAVYRKTNHEYEYLSAKKITYKEFLSLL